MHERDRVLLSAMREAVVLAGYTRATVSTYVGHVRRLCAWAPGRAAELDGAEVRRFLVDLRVTKQATAWLHRLVVSALRFLYLRVLGRPEVMAGIPRPRAPWTVIRVPSTDEIRAVLAAAPTPVARIALLAGYGAGLRISEIARLRVEDVAFDRRVLYVHAGKRGKGRVVMLSHRLAHALREWLRHGGARDGWLLPGRAGRPLTERTLQRLIAASARRAGVGPGFRCHLLRHAFATHLVEAGTDILTVQALLGHARLQYTLRYLHARHDVARDTVSPLDWL